MKDKDDRTSLITEILNSAKSIKFYSWEKPMLKRLGHVRNDRELTMKFGINNIGSDNKSNNANAGKTISGVNGTL